MQDLLLPTRELLDRPPKTDAKFPRVYSIKVPTETKKKIELINEVKEGLGEQIRSAIQTIVDRHWEKIDENLKQGIGA